MEVHAIDTLSGREEPLEIDADATVSAMKRQCGEAFGFGEDVELSVSGQRVACDGAERVSNVAAFSGGCRVGVVRGVAEFVAQLRSGAVEMDDIPVWARQRRECVLAMLANALDKLENPNYGGCPSHWLHPSLHDDKEVMLQYMNCDTTAFVRASAALRSDADFVIAALQRDASMWYHVEDKSLQEQRSVALLAVPHCANSAVWLSDKAFVLEALEKRPVWPYVSKALKQNKEVVVKALLHDKVYFGDLSETLRGDKDFVMKALPVSNALHFSDLSEALQQDKEVVMEAIRCGNLGGFHQLSATLQQDKQVAMRALRMQNVNFSDLSEALREDKKFVMKALDSGIWQDTDFGVTNLHQLSATLREDKEVVMKALRQRKAHFGDLSEALRGDKEVVMQALRVHKYLCPNKVSFSSLSEPLRGDKEVVLEALASDLCLIPDVSLLLGDLSEALREDKEVRLACKRLAEDYSRPRAMLPDEEVTYDMLLSEVKFCNLTEELRMDKVFVMDILQSHIAYEIRISIDELSEAMRGDKEVVMAALVWATDFEKLCPTLQQDREVVMIGFGTNFLQLTPALQKDKDVVMNLLEDEEDSEFRPENRAGRLEFSDLSEAMRGDKEVVMKALERDMVMHFHQMSATLQEDEEVVMEALHLENMRLENLSEALQADEDFVVEAIAANPDIYISVSGPLRHDKHFALVAIAATSGLFRWMAPALRDDLDVALPAIRADPNNFIYAGDSVRADKQAALAAFHPGYYNPPVLLPFASAELQADREVVLAAVRANAKNGEYASPALQDLAASGP